jgi:hypothetical protein
MQTWKGWTTTAIAPGAAPLTWAEWRAWQQGTLQDEELRQHGVPFTAREVARLSFVHWLCQTGRLGPREHDSV